MKAVSRTKLCRDQLSFLERRLPHGRDCLLGSLLYCKEKSLLRSGYSNQYFPNQEVTQGSEGSPMKDGRNVVTSPSLVDLLRG